jgi:hypothetical protein
MHHPNRNGERLEWNEMEEGTLPGGWSRYIVTTLVNIEDFFGFTSNIARNKPSAEA